MVDEMFIRTDRSAFVALRRGHLEEVDAPVTDGVTIEWRAAGPTRFLEVVAMAKHRAVKAAKAEGLDPEEVVTPEVLDAEGKVERAAETVRSKFEGLYMSAALGRGAIYRVHGAPADLTTIFAATPGAAYEMLGPTMASELGRMVMSATIGATRPFGPAGSGR